MLWLVALLAVGTPLCAQTVQDLQAAGYDALDHRDYYSAIEAFGNVLAINPDDLGSIVGMARAYYQLDEYDEAATLAARARELSRRNPAILSLAGLISIGLGDLEAARAFFDDAVAVEPNNVDAMVGLAELALAEGRSLDATGALERALRINPNHRKALLSLVLIYEQAGELETARRYLDTALEVHGTAVEPHILAAQFDLRHGDLIGAASQARAAAAIDASNTTAVRLRATVAILDGRYEEAIATSEELIAVNRDDPEAWYLRGQALVGSGRLDEAMDSLRTALRYDPDNGMIRFVAEDIALRDYPMDAPIRAELAHDVAARASGLEQQFLYSKALAAYRRALRLTPFDTGLRRSYAELYRTLGYTATYLEELTVIRDSGETNSDLTRLISIYTNLVRGNVARDWNVDQFTLPRVMTPIAVFLDRTGAPVSYPRAEPALLGAITRELASLDRTSLESDGIVDGFPAAFDQARSHDVDFFILIGAADSPRSFSLSATVYVGRTGVEAGTVFVGRVGPDRVADAIGSLAVRLNGMIPVRATIVSRRGDLVLLDAGTRDGMRDGTDLSILPPEVIMTRSSAVGYSYDPAAVLGTATIVRRDDLVSEATITVDGLSDAVAPGDVAVIPGETVTERASALGYPVLYDRVRALR